MARPIVLIHGAWLNSVSWSGFKARYESKGYEVIAPDWPLDDRPPADLRNNPDRALAKVGQNQIIDYYERLILALPQEPIIIGHSLGGVFVQHLLDRGLGVAGVAINPAPTPDVPLGPHAIISALPVFSDLLSWMRLKTMSLRFFGARFAQSLPREEWRVSYDRYIVPTPGRVYWDGITGAVDPIDWGSAVRAPLLLIGGGKDLIADASMTQAIYRRQKDAATLTELKIFPDRTHWTCIEPGWEEVADFALNWAITNAQSKDIQAA